MTNKKQLLMVLMILAMGLLTACGLGSSNSSGGSGSSGRAVVPVDDWRPLVQVHGAADTGAFRFETHEIPQPPEFPTELLDLDENISEEELQQLHDQHMVALLTFLYGEDAAAAAMRATWNSRIVLEYFPVDAWGMPVFPSYVGGILIGSMDDYVVELHLHVMIVESRMDEAADFLEFLSNLEDVIIVPVEFSLNELNETSELIRLRRNTFRSRINTHWVDIVANRVVVAIVNYGEEAKELFRNEIIDSPMVIFQTP